MRNSPDPRGTLLEFLQSACDAGAATAGWDADGLGSSWMVSSPIGTRRAAPGLRHLGGLRGLCRPKMRWLGVEPLILEIEVTGDSDPDVVADCACATEIKERFPLGVQQLTAQALVVL